MSTGGLSVTCPVCGSHDHVLCGTMDTKWVTDASQTQATIVRLEADRDQLRALLAEAGEYTEHVPGRCRIALGFIDKCDCGADEYDARRQAALSGRSE